MPKELGRKPLSLATFFKPAVPIPPVHPLRDRKRGLPKSSAESDQEATPQRKKSRPNGDDIDSFDQGSFHSSCEFMKLASWEEAVAEIQKIERNEHGELFAYFTTSAFARSLFVGPRWLKCPCHVRAKGARLCENVEMLRKRCPNKVDLFRPCSKLVRLINDRSWLTTMRFFCRSWVCLSARPSL